MQNKKAYQKCVRNLQPLRALWLPWQTQQFIGGMCFTNNNTHVQTMVFI